MDRGIIINRGNTVKAMEIYNKSLNSKRKTEAISFNQYDVFTFQFKI